MPDFRRAVERRVSRLGLDPTRQLEIVDEISQHLHDRYDELRARGLSDADAARDALSEIPTLAAQLSAVEHPVPLDPPIFASGGRTVVDALLRDIQYALRTFARQRVFTAVVVLTLALGIGATTAIFSVVDGVMLRPLPYTHAERIVTIGEQYGAAGGFMSVAWPDFQDWRDQNQVFEALGIYRGIVVNLTGGDQPERLSGAVASSGLFATMGIAPIAGRPFQAAEDRPGADRIAIVSERLWRSRFNADPHLVGRTVLLNGQSYEVTGIMPASMRFPSRLTDVWLPLGLSVPSFPPRGDHPGLFAVGLLKLGVNFEQAVADMHTVSQRLAAQYPESNTNVHAALTPYYEQVVRNIRPALLVLICAVGFVLLIACANLANLMLSRADGRQREVAIRGALGAARGCIVRQLMVESLLLAAAGGALGAVLAFWTVRAFVQSQPATVPRIDLLAVDGRVLLFTAAISIATGILFGLAPALRAASTDLIAGLREGGRGSASAGSRRLRSALIVAEVALALVLLVAAGLTLRSFGRLVSIDPGFNPSRLVTARLTLPDAKYPDRASWTVFHRELLRRVSTLPGVDSVALSSALPLEGGGAEAPVIAEGDPMPSPSRPATTTLFQTTSPDYFRTMGIQLLRGREFTEHDTAAAAPVVIVDETLVHRVFHDADPIGKRLAFEMRGHSAAARQMTWREVVGVVRHVRHYGLTTEPPFVQLYTPFEQLPANYEQRRPSMALAVRTALEPEPLASSIRHELAAIDRDIPLYGLQTMERYVSQNLEQQRLSMVLLTGFGALALLLAVIGIYGVLSYAVSRRRHEIGIRLALGATRRDVLTLVVGDGMRLTLTGIAVGLAAAYAATRLLTSLLFEVSPHDPATFVGLALLLAVVALAACLLPARRAATVDPLGALRTE